MAGEPAEPRLLVPVGAHPPTRLGVFSPGQSLPRRLGPQSLGPGLSGCHTHIWPPGGSVFCDDAASLSACLGMTKLWTQWGAALPQHPGGGQSQHHTALSPSLLYCKTRVPGCPAPTGGAPVSGAGERKGALPQAAPGGSWSKKQAPRGMRAGRTAGWEGPTGQDRPHLRGPGKGVSWYSQEAWKSGFFMEKLQGHTNKS